MRHLKYKKKTHDNLFDNNKHFYWNIKKTKRQFQILKKNYYFFLIFILTKTKKKNENYFLN